MDDRKTLQQGRRAGVKRRSVLKAGALGVTGGMLLPWISGHLAAVRGIHWVFGLVAVSFLCIGGLSALIARMSKV